MTLPSGREEVRDLVIGALSCNLAWGLIDAAFYLMGSFSMLGQGILTLKALSQAATQAEANQIIADALTPVLACVLSSAGLERTHKRLKQVSNVPTSSFLRKDDWLGALGIFLIVFLATLPVWVPFALIRNARPALRVSNGVAIVMHFLTGYAFLDGICIRTSHGTSPGEDGDRYGNSRWRLGCDHNHTRRLRTTRLFFTRGRFRDVHTFMLDGPTRR